MSTPSEPDVPASYEDELVMKTVAHDVIWLEWEIRQAERAYHRLVKKAAWSPADCMEVDAIEDFLAVHKKWLAELIAGY
jgi:hypothetical protein